MRTKSTGSAAPRARPSSDVLRIWGWPVALGVLSIFGLLSALLGQGGIWWVLSWIALAVPIGVIVVCIRASRGVIKRWDRSRVSLLQRR